jgi:hypothetical protein
MGAGVARRKRKLNAVAASVQVVVVKLQPNGVSQKEPAPDTTVFLPRLDPATQRPARYRFSGGGAEEPTLGVVVHDALTAGQIERVKGFVNAAGVLGAHQVTGDSRGPRTAWTAGVQCVYI